MNEMMKTVKKEGKLPLKKRWNRAINFNHSDGKTTNKDFAKGVYHSRTGGTWSSPKILHKQIYLYKKVTAEVNGKEVNAVIKMRVPAGELIYAENTHSKGSRDYRKVRVSLAIPVSIMVERSDGSYGEERTSFKNKIISGYEYEYRYNLGRPAVPEEPYSMYRSQCESGIHGFFDIEDAKNW